MCYGLITIDYDLPEWLRKAEAAFQEMRRNARHMIQRYRKLSITKLLGQVLVLFWCQRGGLQRRHGKPSRVESSVFTCEFSTIVLQGSVAILTRVGLLMNYCGHHECGAKPPAQ